jgi:preprotein translocase SecE subunit
VAKTIGKNRASATRARPAAGSGVVEGSARDRRAGELAVADDADELENASEADEIALDQEAAQAASRALAERPITTTGVTRRPAVPQPLMGNPITRYLAESAIELRYNVTWPVPREAWNMTLIVIAMSAFVAALLGLSDVGLIRALDWVVNLGITAPGR